MPIITIRDVDEETKRSLQVLAAMHGRSMEAEIREILRYSVREAPDFMPESAAPDRELPPATDQAAPLPMDQEIPLATNGEELIASINRQLEQMGLSHWALPENPPPE